MNNIILNSKYAPGVPTYGTSGQDGNKGDNGRSLFFVPFDINNNKDFIKSLINNKKIYGVDDLEYTYSIGDSFIQPDGTIWQYTNINKIQEVGKITFNSDTYFAKEVNENFIYNNTHYNFILSDDTPSFDKENNNYLFTIDSNNGNILKLKTSDNEFTISYDITKDGFVFYSNKPIYFDNLYAVANNSNNNSRSVDNIKKGTLGTPPNNEIWFKTINDEVFGNNILFANKTLPDTIVMESEGITENGDKYYIIKDNSNDNTGKYFNEGILDRLFALVDDDNNILTNELLLEVSLPNSIKYITTQTFAYCTKLEYVSFSENIVSIEQGAFFECKSLDNVELPDTLLTIGNSCFQNCINLKNIKLNSINEIGILSFQLTSIEEIIFPNTLKTIYTGAFNNCPIKKVYFNSSIPPKLINSSSLGEAIYITDNLTLYVPSEYENNYKNSENGWQLYLDYIYPYVYINEGDSEIENNNYQPIITTFDILNDFSITNINDVNSYDINNYYYEINYTAKKEEGTYSKKKLIEIIENEVILPSDFNTEGVEITSCYFIITSKQYFVSKYYNIKI